MRLWAKWMVPVAAALLAGSALASDHADGPAAASSAEADINDLYAWLSKDGDSSKVVLIQTLGGGQVVTAFDPTVQLVFHVTRHEASADDPETGTTTDIICEFASNTEVSCWVGTSAFVSGDPTDSLSSKDGKLKVHAGLHKDPAFYHSGGFDVARQTVLGLKPPQYASGCPKLDQATVDKLRSEIAGDASNTYANAKALAIVMEVDSSLFAGTGEVYSVWASTHVKEPE